MIELVIFDCDGVLVDSEPISNRILAEDVTAAGWPMTTDDCISRFKGGKLTQVQLEIEERIGRSLGPDWLDRHYARMFDAFRGEIQPIPGVRDVIEQLRRRNIPMCVASQGPIRKMEVTLGSTGLWPLLEGHIYSADAVARPKPAPDLFLHAARSEGADPETCLVVEDSATGIRAAVAPACGRPDSERARTATPLPTPAHIRSSLTWSSSRL